MDSQNITTPLFERAKLEFLGAKIVYNDCVNTGLLYFYAALRTMITYLKYYAESYFMIKHNLSRLSLLKYRTSIISYFFDFQHKIFESSQHLS